MKRIVLLALILTSLSSTAFALKADPGCENKFAEVALLGGDVRMEGVERINDARLTQLTKYTQGASVQAQLRRPHRHGYVSIRDERIAGALVFERSRQFFIIESVIVDPTLEKQGIGRDLVVKVIKDAIQAPDIHDVRILVAQTDSDAQAFFIQLGFKVTETIPEKFSDHTEAGVLMKIKTSPNQTETEFKPQLKLEPKPQAQPARIATTTIPISFERLQAIDPTLEHARD